MLLLISILIQIKIFLLFAK